MFGHAAACRRFCAGIISVSLFFIGSPCWFLASQLFRSNQMNPYATGMYWIGGGWLGSRRLSIIFNRSPANLHNRFASCFSAHVCIYMMCDVNLGLCVMRMSSPVYMQHGYTALMYAAQRGYYGLAELAIGKGARVAEKNNVRLCCPSLTCHWRDCVLWPLS